MNPVVHFEMPFDDKARLTRFYEQAFGWQMQGMGAEMGDYVLATTTPSDAGGRPTGIGGRGIAGAGVGGGAAGHGGTSAARFG